MPNALSRACRLALLVALAGCARQEPALDAGDALRRGIVTVGADEASRYPLTWTPPAVAVEGTTPGQQLRKAREAATRGDLFATADSAIPRLLAAERMAVEDPSIPPLRASIVDALVAQGDRALADVGADAPDANARLHAIAAVARTLDATSPAVRLFLARVDASDKLESLLELGRRDLADGRLGETGIGAIADFKEVLRSRPADVRAGQGLVDVQLALVQRALAAAAVRDYPNVLRWMAHAKTVRRDDALMATQWGYIERQRIAQIEALHADARIHLQDPAQRDAIPRAQADLAEMKRIAVPADGLVPDLARRIDLAIHYGQFAPGQQFREALRAGGIGPRVVVVPRGGFMMGAAPDDPDARKAELPAHPVLFRRGFALAATEVTVGQYAQFIAGTGYVTRAERRGHSIVYDERSGNFARRSGVTWREDYRGAPASNDTPVVHVDVNDAEAYARWLSDQTGRPYRLPSEAEFEYAMRAGGKSLFPWGGGAPAPAPRVGNLTGQLDRSPTGHGWANGFPDYGDGAWGPAPAGRYPANAFGLHDMEGNVSEWTADCWHQGYRRAPSDGAGWINPGCRSRVVRGGSWASSPSQDRAAWRMAQPHDATNARTGFRVARDL